MTGMAICCAPLVLRSNFSLLTGTASIEKIVERARQLRLQFVALTDLNNLYGAIPFYLLAQEAGIKPIIGAEVHSSGSRAVLLARDMTGYANLCKVISRRNLDENFSLAECLAVCHEGLHILTEDVGLAAGLVHRTSKDPL